MNFRCIFDILKSNPNAFRSGRSTFTGVLRQNVGFVPKFEISESKLDYITQEVNDFILKHRNIFVITGAGVSTESGIRDYRSEGVGLYHISTQRPMDYREFLRSERGRQRYWARNFAGWKEFSSRQPNSNHFTLAKLEKLGFVHWLVTQNVDALHSKAGTERLTELHGCSHRVVCLNCHQVTSRHELQERLHQLNPHWHAIAEGQAPDGDTFLPDNVVEGFHVASCLKCDGILKPEVVFFGDSVPKDTVKQVSDHLKQSCAVLVIGSSVEVFSAYRHMLQAKEQNKPIAILNIGKTRADHLAEQKWEAISGKVLPRLGLLQ